MGPSPSSSSTSLCLLFLFIKKKKGHREVTSETLLPIILEVGTLGHILLTDNFLPGSEINVQGDKFQLQDFHWQHTSHEVLFFPSSLKKTREEKDNAQIRKQTLM